MYSISVTQKYVLPFSFNSEQKEKEAAHQIFIIKNI